MKKLFALPVVALTLAAAPLYAQTDAAPAPSAPAAATGAEPDAQVSQFFQTLIEGRVEAAYDQLLKGTKIVEMPKDVINLKAKTKEALRVFGSVNGFEQIDVKKVGSRLVRLTCMSQGKDFPIRWRFYFYKATDAWKLVDIRIDDRLVDFFEEPPRVIAAPAPAQPAK